MKITKNSLCYMVSDKDYINHHITHIDRQKKIYTDEKNILIHEIKKEFYNYDSFRILVLSNKTKKNLENYLIPKEIRLDVLNSLPNRSDIIQVDEKSVFKYIKTDNGLNVTLDTINEDNGLQSYWFMINLKNGHVSMDTFNEKLNKVEHTYEDLIKTYYGKFLVLVTYLELTDVTLDIVKPNTKKGDIFKGNFIKNDSNCNVIQVNTNWNVIKIVVGEFKVRSHMRLQRVGVGLKQFKYVKVNEYKKNLVIRNTQKSLVR